MNQIDELLELTVESGASDLHMSSGYHPCIRIDGGMKFLTDFPILTPEKNMEIIMEILPERNRTEFTGVWDTDCSYALDSCGRFRVNAFMDQKGAAAVFRTIPEKIPTMEQLGLTFADTLKELSMHTKGLIIVTGPTGSGKSTTLASMMDLINRTRTEHIISIEDPVEFTHESKGCLINQREVHHHTKSFAGALRAALREDPDIVLLGEMRDLETTEIALETAETGHLVLATLHTNTATSTVDRIIDKFPAGQQNQIRTLLSNTLTAVVAQTLCKKEGGGRVAAAEILVATSAVRAMIRDQKTHQLPTAIQVGHNVGMISFTDSLFELVNKGLISSREAYLKAVDKVSLEMKFKENGIEIDKTLTEISSVTDFTEEQMNSPDFLRDRAWILLTNTDTAQRDPVGALDLIQRAIELSRGTAENLMVLAAAHAAQGNTGRAMDYAKQSMQQAKQNKNNQVLQAVKGHLALYKAGKALP